jgi:hypothetical protein
MIAGYYELGIWFGVQVIVIVKVHDCQDYSR